jgi:hypothetical protein
MLIVVREVNRCIKILDNISLRGGFWPGACAAAIKDLQQALQKKVENDVSGARGGILSRRYGTPRPSSGVNQASRQPVTGLNGHTRPTPSISIQQTVTGSHTSSGSFQPRNPPNTINSAQTSGVDLLANRASSARTRPISPSQNAAPFNYSWPGLEGGLFEMDDQFNGFDDIFQLIDVPFHLNEHGAQTTW